MYTERITHPTTFGTLCAVNLFATNFTVVQSSTNVLAQSSLSAQFLYADNAYITRLFHTPTSSAVTVVNANSANWNSVYSSVPPLTSNWQNTFNNFSVNSASYILQNGNLLSQNITIGTQDQFNLNLETSNTVRVAVLSSGQVGIGTTTPANPLHIRAAVSSNAAEAHIKLTNTVNTNESFIASDINGFTRVGGLSGVGLVANGSEGIRAIPGGNVGVGTTSPNERLTVSGNISATGNILAFGNVFSTGNTNVTGNLIVGGNSTTNGNVGIGTAASSQKLAVTDNTTNDAVRITQTGAGNALAVYDVASDTTPFVIDAEGHVGVGVAVPLSSLHVADTILTTPILCSLNQNQPYLIAGTTSHTGSTASWGTYGYQHRFKTDSSGVPRLTIDTSIAGTPTELFTVFSTGGFVGIGTSQPQQKLTVTNGNFFLSNNIPTFSISENDGGVNAKIWDIVVDNSTWYLRGVNDSYSSATDILTVTRSGMTINNVVFPNGNVGIGTSTPNERLTIVGNISATGSIFSQGIGFDTATTDSINSRSSQQLVLNAGESSTFATGQTNELVYINAESGLAVTSSPDNWASGWARRYTTIINNASGNSAFGLSGSFINQSPLATIDAFGTIKFGERNRAIGFNAGGFLSNIWTSTEGFKFFTLGSTYFDPNTSRWITNQGSNWGSNNVVNIAGDGDGIKIYATAAAGGNTERINTTAEFNAFERVRIDLNGNVGIGAPSPSDSRVTIAGSSNVGGGVSWNSGTNFITLSATNSNYSEQAIAFQEIGTNVGAKIGVKNTGNGAYDIVFANRAISSSTSPLTEKVRIKNDGFVGIGTNNPQTRLDVSGVIRSTQNSSAAVSLLASDTGGREYRVVSTDNSNGLGGGRFAIYDETAASARVTILSSGEVGFGTNNPVAPLTFANTVGPKIDLENGGADRYGFGTGSGVLQIYSGAGGPNEGGIAFGNRSNTTFNETVRIIKNGSVGIGRTNPQALFHVNGNAGVASFEGSDHVYLQLYPRGFNQGRKGYIGFPGTGSTSLQIANEDNGPIRLTTAGAGTGVTILSGTGFVGVNTTTPSEALTVSGNISTTGSLTATKATFTGSGTAIATSGLTFNSFPMLERVAVINGTANATSTLDAMTTNVWVFTQNSTNDWTHNVRGAAGITLDSIMAVGDSLTITVISKQNTTAWNTAGLSIDGTARTVLWEGGAAPTTGLSTANYDAYTFTIIKTGANTFLVFGSQSRLG